MHWIVSDISQTRTLVIPYYSTGEQLDFTAQLVIDEGESFDQAYLCVLDTSYVGILSMRIEPDYLFVDVMGPLDSNAYLGHLVGPCVISIVFRIETESDFTGGEHAISIGMFHGQNLVGPPPTTFCASADDDDNPLWGEEESDAPLWTTINGGAPYWQSGSMCARADYVHVAPGEDLSKGNLVCVDTLGTEKLLKLAYRTASQGEANVLGIIDDTAVNYVHHLDGAVSSDGTYVYWQGGYVDSSVTDRLCRFDYATRLWYLLAEGLIDGRAYHTSTWYAGKLYIWGGRSSTGDSLNTIFVFDPETSQWTELTSGGTARSLHAAILIEDKIHFVGGLDDNEDILRSVDIYDITNDSWSTGTEAPVAFENLDIAITPLSRPLWQVCNGILFYGGNAAIRTEEFWTYNSDGEWSSPTPLDDLIAPGRNNQPNVPLILANSLPQHVVRIRPYSTDGEVNWVGLPTTDSRTADVYSEDCGAVSTIDIGLRRVLCRGFITDSSWSLTPEAQYYLSVTPGEFTDTRPDAGFITILGEAVSATTLCFDPQPPFFYLVCWSKSAIAYSPNGIYEFGGDDGSGITDRLRYLDYSTMEWQELTPGCTARENAAMVYSAGILYIIGGRDENGDALSTMCMYNTRTGEWSIVETGLTPAYDQTIVDGGWVNGGTYVGDWTSGVRYEVDDIVYLNGVYFQAIKAGVATASNEPQFGEDWQEYWSVVPQITEWSAGLSVSEYQIVSHDGILYVSTADHTTSSATEPGEGADWETVWNVISYAPPWESGANYDVNDIVSNDGSYYVAVSSHTSGSSTEPGVGADWETVWKLVTDWSSATEYSAWDVVLNDGHFYVATADHTSASSTEPGVGSDWATVWQLIDIESTWISGVSVSASDAYFHNGVWYVATQNHTTSSTTEPSVGADWEDYWVVAPQETPLIFIIDGVDDNGDLIGDVDVYDPNTDEWTHGDGAGDQFEDDFTVTTNAFEAAQETALAVNTNETNQSFCTSYQNEYPNSMVTGVNGKIYTPVTYNWTEYGEIPYYQRLLVIYDIATDTWEDPLYVSGDDSGGYGQDEQPYLALHVFGYGSEILVFGMYTRFGTETYVFGVHRINASTGVMTESTFCRANELEPGVNDRLGASFTYYNNKIYVYGGRGTVSTKLDVFDLGSFSWSTGTTNLGTNRLNHTATIQNDTLYLYYGYYYNEYDDREWNNTTQKININTGQITDWVVPEDYQNYSGESCTDDDGNLYFQGFAMFNPSDESWTKTTNEIYPNTVQGMTYYNGAIYYPQCDGDNGPQMSRLSLGFTSIPIPLTTKIIRNKDGTLVVFTAPADPDDPLDRSEKVVQLTLSSKSKSKASSEGQSAGTGSGGQQLDGKGDPVVSQMTVKTGASNEVRGGDQSERSYTISRNSSGSQSVNITIERP